MSFTPFNASGFLDSEEVIAEYLAAALEDLDPELSVAALGDVATAKRRYADLVQEIQR